MLFPEPAIIDGGSRQGKASDTVQERTFAVNPQQGAR